jgi:hypothetical protein
MSSQAPAGWRGSTALGEECSADNHPKEEVEGESEELIPAAYVPDRAKELSGTK